MRVAHSFSLPRGPPCCPPPRGASRISRGPWGREGPNARRTRRPRVEGREALMPPTAGATESAAAPERCGRREPRGTRGALTERLVPRSAPLGSSRVPRPNRFPDRTRAPSYSRALPTETRDRPRCPRCASEAPEGPGPAPAGPEGAEEPPSTQAASRALRRGPSGHEGLQELREGQRPRCEAP